MAVGSGLVGVVALAAASIKALPQNEFKRTWRHRIIFYSLACVGIPHAQTFPIRAELEQQERR